MSVPNLPRQTPVPLPDVVRKFWWPVYGQARCAGCAPALAAQVTAVVLQRSAVVSALNHDEAHDGRLRRMMKAQAESVLKEVSSLSAPGMDLRIDLAAAEARDDYLTPKAADSFSWRWKVILLEEALRDLHQAHLEQGEEAEWSALKPFLAQRAAGEPEAQEPQHLVNPIRRLRNRFRLGVRRRVGETVSTPSALEQEFRELFLEA